MNYDLIVVGMGPSAVFLAYELIQLNNYKNILLIDQGKPVQERFCPIEKIGKCAKCKPHCNITCGFSGAGAFSDGKLNSYQEIKMVVFILEETEQSILGNILMNRKYMIY